MSVNVRVKVMQALRVETLFNPDKGPLCDSRDVDSSSSNQFVQVL